MVFVAVLSSERTLALVPDESPGRPVRWVLPSGSAWAAEPYRDAAMRVLRDVVGAMPTHGGAGEGRHWAQVPVPVGQSRREAHVFIYRLMAAGSPPKSLPRRGPVQWAGPDQWPELCAHCDLPDVDALLTGYLEGWIPDGRITLGP